MNGRKRKVAVIGALNVDIAGLPEAAFVPGDSIPGHVTESLGGVGWNIARNCASLGAETVFFSVLGKDGRAEQIRRSAEAFGVDISPCRWAEEPNNRYLYIRGRNGEMAAAVNDMRLTERMDESFMESILPALAGFDAAAADANLSPGAFRVLAEGLSIPLAVDCVSAVKCGRLRDHLPLIHTLKANRMEAETLTGRIGPEDCARALMDSGVTRVVISLGGEGVLCGEGGRLLRLPAVTGPVTDTTGAGDSLTAALTVGLARGLSLEACAELGVRAAGMTAGAPGAVTAALRALALPAEKI